MLVGGEGLLYCRCFVKPCGTFAFAVNFITIDLFGVEGHKKFLMFAVSDSFQSVQWVHLENFL